MTEDTYKQKRVKVFYSSPPLASSPFTPPPQSAHMEKPHTYSTCPHTCTCVCPVSSTTSPPMPSACDMSPVEASMLNSSAVITDLIHCDRGCTTFSTLSMRWGAGGGGGWLDVGRCIHTSASRHAHKHKHMCVLIASVLCIYIIRKYIIPNPEPISSNNTHTVLVAIDVDLAHTARARNKGSPQPHRLQ